ncbi:molybdopterin-dependent oxidoreductase [Bermanella marisrubri]|uniref:nitrate reductase (cytochrome) n=1 Tax=Bermanella marisrubri TaxID=207949 RepID=Q1N0E8_9GAMM|nr:nitrate reductase [Bermanella marisrubri]EAT11716.1 Anaerobic dehydrogenase, typically selenocysteine-containing [Oceanobacter sp. RED65] [Bermanella marisrubri]QIZ83249.1 molybdopterin-dependent oxidoreductase [Bermanella marisrubri]
MNQAINTTCAYCGVGCGIKADVNKTTREISIIGSDQHPANYGRLCSKGTALGNTLEEKGRLLSPLVKGQKTSWSSAIDHVANGFQSIIEQHGPDAVAFYVSGQLLTEDYYVANKLMKGFMGSGNIDTNSRLCMSSSVVGHKRAFGTDTVPGCYEDFEKAKLITLVGSNTAWCHPVLFQRIKRYKANNPDVKVVVIDPRKTATCDIADLHIPLALGTDSWLFNGLLHYLADNDYLNQEFIYQHCNGFDAALESAASSSADLKHLSKILSVELTTLKTFFKWFANTEQAVTLYSQGVNQSSSGSDKVNTIINCHLATGRIGRPGMGPFSMTGQPNAMGGREVGGLANTLAAHLEFNDSDIEIVKTFWDAPNMAHKPGRMAVDMFEAIERGEIKAVWIMATNPVVSLPNADQIKRALNQAELVIVSDCIEKTDTTAYADVCLPALGWSEKDGTVTNSERRISRQRALLEPLGEAKPDWWIICQVAQAMGFKESFDYPDAASIFREHAQLSGYKNTPEERLRDFDISRLSSISSDDYDNLNPFQWPINDSYPQGRERFFAQGDFFTPDRKANFLAIEPNLPKEKTSKQYPLKLNTGRIRDQWHTMTRTALAAQLNQHINEPFLQMHPTDAQQQNVHTGQIVQVTSQWGQMLAKLEVTDNVKQGDVFAPMHWTEQLSSRGRINTVVNPHVDPFSKQPESKHTPVNVHAFDLSMYGLLLTRQDLSVVDCAYQVSIRGAHSQQYQLAHHQWPSDPEQQLLDWLNIRSQQDLEKRGWQWIHFADARRRNHRLAILNEHGRLEALAMIQSSAIDCSTTWLQQQFAKESLSGRDRQALLSGHAPAGEDVGNIVCACFSVGSKTIEGAIKQGCRSVSAVGERLKAGTNCGSCIPEIKQLIAKA